MVAGRPPNKRLLLMAAARLVPSITWCSKRPPQVSR